MTSNENTHPIIIIDKLVIKYDEDVIKFIVIAKFFELQGFFKHKIVLFFLIYSDILIIRNKIICYFFDMFS